MNKNSNGGGYSGLSNRKSNDVINSLKLFREATKSSVKPKLFSFFKRKPRKLRSFASLNELIEGRK